MLMILPQMFRHVGAMAMFPGIGDTPGEWSQPLAWGDAITAWLAIVSTISLHLRFSHATKIVWAFNIWGTLDLLHNGYNAARLQIAPRLGVIGYVVAFCVPMMLVFHLLIFRSLIRHPYPDR